MTKQIIITILFLITSIYIFSQNTEIDSLRKVITSTKIDTVKVNTLNKLSQKLIRYNISNALDSINLSVEISKNTNYQFGLAHAYKIKGIIFYYNGEVDTAFKYFDYSLNIFIETKNLIDAAKIYNNIGIIYRSKGDFQKSIDSYLKAIELLEKTEDLKTLITVYINASNVFANIGNYQRALEYNFNALKISDKNKNKTAKDSTLIGQIYNSIANIYSAQKKYDEADSNYFIALNIFLKLNSQTDIGDIYINLGVIKIEEKKYRLAIYYYRRALTFFQNKNKIALAYLNLADAYIYINVFDKAYISDALKFYQELKDRRGIAISLNTFGQFFKKQNQTQNAIKFYKQGLDTALLIGDIEIIKNSSEGLYELYKLTGDFQKSLEMHELFKLMQDSIFNTSNENSMTQLSLTYEFEKEQEQAELKFQEEIKRQKIIRNFVFAVLFLVILMLISVFYSLRLKKRKNDELRKKNAEILQHQEEIITQRDEIEAQRDEINEKSKEIENQRDIAIKRGDEIERQKKDIEASIYYALRIQQAIMPDITFLKNQITSYFLFFKPRDIVSGDFYWASHKENKTIIVAADCTGHGVPGAFMSMLGISFLNQIVSEMTDLQSNEILNFLRKMIIKSLKQNVDEVDGNRDGMDISIIVIDKNNNELQYSGAYNPAFMITKKDNLKQDNYSRPLTNENTENILIEFKADRMPIGVFIVETSSFSKTTFPIQKNDKIYLFSDGYPDLYNRNEDKKFTTRRFKELLFETSNLSMKEQKIELENNYKNWVGDQKQIDDILVIGIEI